MTRLRLLRAALFLIPCAALAISYAGVSAQAGTWWPWFSVVHEDGERTLLGTVLYFEHATRELPLDIVLGCGLAAATVTFFSLRGATGNTFRLVAGSVAILTVILFGTLLTTGARSLIDNLGQMHTRPGSPLLLGSHWRYHLLERLSLLLCGFALAGISAVLTRCGHLNRRRAFWMALVLGVYAVVSLWFGVTREPFLDPVYLGHQARELVTHGLITVPLGLAVCLGAADCTSGSPASRGRVPRVIWIAAIAGIASGGYLLAAAFVVDARSHGQTTGLAALLFPHVFEHTFSYVVVPLSGATVLSFRRRFARPPAGEGPLTP